MSIGSFIIIILLLFFFEQPLRHYLGFPILYLGVPILLSLLARRCRRSLHVAPARSSFIVISLWITGLALNFVVFERIWGIAAAYRWITVVGSIVISIHAFRVTTRGIPESWYFRGLAALQSGLLAINLLLVFCAIDFYILGDAFRLSKLVYWSKLQELTLQQELWGWAPDPGRDLRRMAFGNAVDSAWLNGIVIAVITLGLRNPIFSESRKTRWMSYASIAMALLAIILSQSRSPLLLVALCLASLILSRQSMKRRLTVIIGFAVATLVCASIFRVSDDTAARYTIEYAADQGSTVERLYLVQVATDLFIERPLLGAGFGGFSLEHLARFDRMQSAESVYLQVGAESGIVGLLAMIVVLVALSRTYFPIMTRDESGRRTAQFSTPLICWMALLTYMAFNPLDPANPVIFMLFGFLMRAAERSWSYDHVNSSSPSTEVATAERLIPDRRVGLDADLP